MTARRAVTAAVLICALAGCVSAKRREDAVANDKYGYHYTEDFASLDHWVNRPAEHADWRVVDGAFVGAWRSFYNTLIFKRPIRGDTELLVDFEMLPIDWENVTELTKPTDTAARIAKYRKGLPAEGAMNFNILFKGSGPEGEDFLKVYDEWIGRGKMGLQHFRTYFFTLTYLWGRMRRCPGYELMSDRKDIRSRVGHVFHARILQEGNRFRYWLDGELLHDVTDPNAWRDGYIGFTLSASRVRISRIELQSEN